jgi:hypothetical protein
LLDTGLIPTILDHSVWQLEVCQLRQGLSKSLNFCAILYYLWHHMLDFLPPRAAQQLTENSRAAETSRSHHDNAMRFGQAQIPGNSDSTYYVTHQSGTAANVAMDLSEVR